MTKQTDEQALTEYLDGESDISRAYKQVAKEQTPRHLDEHILSAGRDALQKNKKAGFSLFGARWQIPVSLAAVLVISASLVFTLQERPGTGSFEEPVYDGQHKVPMREQSGATSKIIQAPDTVSGRQLLGQKKQDAAPEIKAESNKSSPVPMENHMYSDSMAAMNEPAATEPMEDVTAESLLVSPATPSMAESVEIYTEDHISALADEISELKESRRVLEVEKATLEQDLKSIRYRRDALKQKITALERKNADVEITGNRAQVAWLNHIRRLWVQEQISLVEQNLADFRQQHPDYPRQQLVLLFSEDMIRRSDSH